MKRRSSRLMVVVLAAMAWACRPDDQRTDSVDPSAVATDLDPAVAVLLDRGNTAYRAADFDAAVTAFEEAAALAPESAAAWFGIYLAQRARGDMSAAEDALERARKVAPGASLLRDDDRAR